MRADREEPLLFDLPLTPPPRRPERPVAAPRTPDEVPDEVPAISGRGAIPVPAAAPRAPAPLRARLLAAGIDLAALVAVLAVALVGARLLQIRPGAHGWPAFAVLALVFSFLYQTVPLAFWGRTPGMARLGLEARGLTGDRLTFYQALARWAGWLITIALAGAPGLLALSGGRSLTDRLSGSRTELDPRA
jgi:uncharacterized RDD family membrane protein YckC